MPNHSLSQNDLLPKINLFLLILDEKLPSWELDHTKGLCNGLVFAALRADFIGELPVFFERLRSLASMDESQVVTLAYFLKLHKENIRYCSQNKALQTALNRELATLQAMKQERDKEIRLSGFNAEGLKNSLKRNEADYQENIVRIRERYFKISEARALEVMSQLLEKQDVPKDTLLKAQDLHAFIHLITATFIPLYALPLYKSDNTRLLQSDYVELLRFLPPDGLVSPITKEIELPHEAFSFQFLFEKPELTAFLKTHLYPHCRVRLKSSNHILYLSGNEKSYTLYDPSGKEEPASFDSIESLVDALEFCFITQFGIATDRLPVSMIAYKQGPVSEEKATSEETMHALLQSILDKRPKGKPGIHSRTWDGSTALHLSIADGNIPLTKALLKAGADPDASLYDKPNSTPLDMAAEQGNTALFELLHAKSRLDVHAQSFAYLAAQSGSARCLAYLNNELKVNLNTSCNGIAPLHIAAQRGHLNVLEFLIQQAGVDLETLSSPKQMTAAHFAVLFGHLSVMHFLKAHNADLNKSDSDGNTPLHHAVCNGHLETLRFLIEEGINYQQTTPNDLTIAHLAAELGHEHIIRFLMKSLADAPVLLNKQSTVHGATPLFMAVQGKQLDTVCLLTEEYTVDVNTPTHKKYTPLHLAVERGEIRIVEALLKAGAEVNTFNQISHSPLFTAIVQGHLDILTLLLNTGADLSRAFNAGVTPAYLASELNNTVMFEFFAKRGEPLGKSIDADGTMSAHIAAARGHADMIRLLSTYKVPLNAVANNGMAPVHFAACQGHGDVIRALSECKADLNQLVKVPPHRGFTAAHLAVESDSLDMIETLFECEADFTCKNANGHTPVDHAIFKNHWDIAAFLLMQVDSPIVLCEQGKNLSKEHLNALIKAAIERIQVKNASPEEEIVQFEQIINQDNALGKILAAANRKPENSLTLFPEKQEDYFEDFRVQCRLLKASLGTDAVVLKVS